MLIAKVIAHALGIESYGKWEAIGWIDHGEHKVCHRSLPFGVPPKYPNIDHWVSSNQDDYDIYFVLTTRDQTLSELSRIDRFKKPQAQVEYESIRAREFMRKLIDSDQSKFIWSYETFMYLERDYLALLYDFLGVESDFVPPIEDGNRKRFMRGS
ncbi:MAG TPA: hypothetical protein EYN73_03110 [Chromatiaceae bacterium]|nr:hypothetical protein [Chromatiaceae bacterium]HIB83522.1 hypothetical protein [Chromatiaceae bacterium]HIN81704.1 hypothetical protein [Chromatiales bacterium]HIO14357.1 hypothetical protein [Chromatiales bacterium]HIO55228.1 hypothetical protein [Chromatiales bacterium]